ncbi:MAG: hypothetical protein Q8J78_01745 [Moraxellaceae bacterium]|nr:hypothetical protein [Moraxellaceae bacterium]
MKVRRGPSSQEYWQYEVVSEITPLQILKCLKKSEPIQFNVSKGDAKNRSSFCALEIDHNDISELFYLFFNEIKDKDEFIKKFIPSLIGEINKDEFMRVVKMGLKNKYE